MAMYAGVTVFNEDSLLRDNMTDYEKENAHKNLMSHDDYTLDVPPSMDSVSAYRATLGHKSNHKFLSNVFFGYFYHPYLGLIRCLISKSFMTRGTEVHVDYDYNMKANFVPG